MIGSNLRALLRMLRSDEMTGSLEGEEIERVVEEKCDCSEIGTCDLFQSKEKKTKEIRSNQSDLKTKIYL